MKSESQKEDVRLIIHWFPLPIQDMVLVLPLYLSAAQEFLKPLVVLMSVKMYRDRLLHSCFPTNGPFANMRKAVDHWEGGQFIHWRWSSSSAILCYWFGCRVTIVTVGVMYRALKYRSSQIGGQGLVDVCKALLRKQQALVSAWSLVTWPKLAW